MESLEQRVRSALIEKKANELYKLMQTPEYQRKLRNSINHLLPEIDRTLNQLMEDEVIDYDRARGAQKVNEYLNNLFSNPCKLREAAYDSATIAFQKKDQLDESLKQVYQLFSEDKSCEPQTLAKLKKARKELYRAIEYQSKIISELAKIARKEGLKKALTDEAEHKVIRKIFPTKREYIKHTMGEYDKARKYIKNLQEITMADGITGKTVGSVFGSINYTLVFGSINYTLNQKDFGSEFVKKSIYKKAEKIYSLNNLKA